MLPVVRVAVVEVFDVLVALSAARFPEIDRVAWFGPDEARRRLKPTQIPFVDRLVETLEVQAVKRDGT